MEFNFSIRGALRDSWTLFKTHWQFFVATAAVVAVLNILGGGKNTPWFISLIINVASFVWTIVMIKISLAAADNKTELLSFSAIKGMLPTWQQALGLLGVGVLSALLVIGGLILLIIPGIYIGFRLGLSNLAYIDRGDGIKKALRYSWDLTQGSVFWTTVLVALTAAALYIIGFALFGIGVLVAYPLAIILMAKFYRALSTHKAGTQAVVEQPVEISAREEHHESEVAA